MRITIGAIVILLFLFCDCRAEQPEKYVPKTARKRELYATPEPGTYLKPVAFSILKKMNQILEEPESYKEPSKWMIRMLTVHQKKVLDTLLHFMDLDVPVRIYYPTKKSLEGNHPVTLFFHGGGFILGSVDQYDLMVSKLARVTGQIIVSVDYRLAPAHPFPAGLMDCYEVLLWFQNQGSEVGADTSRISVMGDSAGGNIATVLTLICRDKQKPQPVCQVLIYPGVTFLDTESPSRIYFGRDTTKQYVLNEAFLQKVKEQYMGNELNDSHPYLSPLEATLTGDLPPALIITAECDPIRDGGRFYAEKLSDAGVQVEHIEYSGMIHAFMSFHMILSDATNAMKQIRDYLEPI